MSPVCSLPQGRCIGKIICKLRTNYLKTTLYCKAIYMLYLNYQGKSRGNPSAETEKMVSPMPESCIAKKEQRCRMLRRSDQNEKW
jgi:hypothetical protein